MGVGTLGCAVQYAVHMSIPSWSRVLFASRDSLPGRTLTAMHPSHNLAVLGASGLALLAPVPGYHASPS